MVSLAFPGSKGSLSLLPSSHSPNTLQRTTGLGVVTIPLTVDRRQRLCNDAPCSQASKGGWDPDSRDLAEALSWEQASPPGALSAALSSPCRIEMSTLPEVAIFKRTWDKSDK